MPEFEQKNEYGQEIFSWQVPEYEKHARGKYWYFGASLTALLLVFYAVWTSNFLFAAIILVGSIVIFLNDIRQPELVRFSITNEGLLVGRRFYDYDEIKDFSLVYKPKQGVKNIYFEFKNRLKPRLSIPLLDINPLPIRENLLRYLTEDLERTDQPTSEALGRMFKL